MKRKSISVKLFIITSIFIIVLLTAIMLLQTMFFESYYQDRKLKEFKENCNILNSEYMKIQNKKELSAYLREFEDRNYAKTAIVDIQNGIRIRFLTQMDKDRIFIRSFKENTKQNAEPFTIPVLPGLLESKTDSVASAISEWQTNQQYYSQVVKDGKPIVFKSNLKEEGVDKIISIFPLPGSSEDKLYLFAVSSLQPVGEAASVIKDMYIYFYILAVILVLALSFVFTKMIAKPLYRMNKVALKMAELDFSAKCEEKNEDEIGNLAHTLNFLSSNLSITLNELKAANEKLLQDIEKEKQLEKMRKEFVAGVSHELKTPISLIMGYSEGLKENLVDGDNREYYIKVISDEASKMGNLVNDMLDLSQLESGRFSLNMEDFCIDELARRIFQKYSQALHTKDFKLLLDIADTNIGVKGDEFRIEQVINNFLNNAIKHTPKNGTIKLSIIDKGHSALVEVENEGSHIDVSEMENIWQKFYKIEKSRNRDIGGTGLGLAIAKNILQLHSSKYGVENTVTGVKFFFELLKIWIK